MFPLSFKHGNNDPTRDNFDEYYILLEKIKGFNALINNQSFFDQPVKNKREAYEKLFKMSRNYDFTTETLDFSFHQNYYKLIGIDLSRQRNTNSPQQINFTGKL